MNKLSYYTSEAVENLRRKIQAHLEWYYREEGIVPDLSPIDGIRESSLDLTEFESNLVVDPSRRSSSDPENALVVYDALRSLTPHQASLECLWVYLSHCVCADYVRKRWLARRPPDDAKAVKNVKNHFFARGTRALLRDNGVSRLWWLGKTAHDAAPEDPSEFLQILLHKQDVRSALLERPSVSMNIRVLQGIYAVMREDWQDERKLFERFTFRDWMKALNRRGGVVLLDSLSDKELKELLRSEAAKALQENQGG